MSEMEERPPFKRKADSVDNASRKSAKMASNGLGGSKMSFAQRMMAKMGHIEGQGLGKGGEGILNPIEVKLRPQGAGVGAVKEKTEQAKAEARRVAEQRGEQYEDSSEEQRKARRKRKEAEKSAAKSGASTPSGFTRPKTRYKTAAEIEASTDGLEIPNVLKSLIDATGKETKLLTSTAGLMTPMPATLAAETGAEKIAKRARRDLEGFVESWNDVIERKKFVEVEQQQIRRELEEQENEVKKLQAIADATQGLVVLNLHEPRRPGDVASSWDSVVGRLDTIQTEYRDEMATYDLASVAVAAIQPLFKQEMLDWSPLKQPTHLVSSLHRLRAILGVKSSGDSRFNEHDDFDRAQGKSTAAYESLIYNLWLPRVRTVITNEWDPHDPMPLLALVEAWKGLLPPFIYYSVINVQIVAKLSATLQAWNPRVASKRANATKDNHRKAELLPHIWLFPWLQYLSDQHTDPRSSHGLLADVKRKLRVALDTWDLGLGVLPGLSAWREVLGPELEHALLRHLMPRLSLHLQEDFQVYPPDQDLTALENVLAWNTYFKPHVMAQLLAAEFFPKWLSTLHSWLTGEECNYEEVGQWFTWWKTQIPANINALLVVQEQWNRGLEMLNAALDLADRGAPVELLAPSTARAQPPTIPAVEISASINVESHATRPAVTAVDDDETTFRDVVEEWCAEHDLTLKPLREAHDTTGLPLFRVSASADGKSGGAKVFLKGDVVWAQSRKDRSKWEPVALGTGLMERAEMR